MRKGTRKWCPTCKEVRLTSVVSPSIVGNSRHQVLQLGEDPGLVFFQRAVICDTCGSDWTTVEIDKSFLYELRALRKENSKLKAEIGLIRKYFQRASPNLNVLAELLSVSQNEE